MYTSKVFTHERFFYYLSSIHGILFIKKVSPYDASCFRCNRKDFLLLINDFQKIKHLKIVVILFQYFMIIFL